MTKNYTEADYLRFDPFSGDMDVDIECRQVAIVTTRTPHKCMAAYLVDRPEGHEIPAGTRAWKETAKVEGQFGSCFCCLECLAKLMRKFYE